MPANVFISFDHDDQQQVTGFKALINNPNHPLDCHDHSLEVPVIGRRGKPLMYPPNDPRARPVRKEILKKFDKASRMVVLVGQSTHSSAWVNWEIVTFFEKKKRLPDGAIERIIAMRLSGCDNAPLPPSLNGRSSITLPWDPRALDRWLDMHLTP